MIRSSIATRLGTLAAIAACFAGLLAPEASAQGSCRYTDISIQPNGDLSIVCDSSGGSIAPNCTMGIPVTATKGQAFSISANCSPAATTFNWTSNSGATLPTGSSGSVAIGAVGTYTFAVSGTNSAGTGPAVTKSVSVQEPVARGGPPNCSAFTANPNPVAVGTPTTISLTCTETPTVYAWSMYAGPAGAMSGFSTPTSSGTQTVTFSSAGTYNFAAQARNRLGGSGMAGLSVSVTSGNNGSSGCSVPTNAVPPTQGYETLGNLRFDLKPGQSGYQQFDFPLAGFSSARVSITGATRLDTPPNTVSEIAVADCPGKFDVPDACKVTVLGSGGLNFYIGPTSDCPLSAKKYYVNIRDTTCTPSSGFPACAHYIKVNGQ